MESTESNESNWEFVKHKKSPRSVVTVTVPVPTSSVSCDHCSKPGHSSKQCWYCENCQKHGHTSDYCWYCERCKTYGHLTEKCKTKMKYCSLCDKVGHEDSVCNSTKKCKLCLKIGHPSQLCKSDKWCKYCKETTHFSGECDEQRYFTCNLCGADGRKNGDGHHKDLCMNPHIKHDHIIC